MFMFIRFWNIEQLTSVYTRGLQNPHLKLDKLNHRLICLVLAALLMKYFHLQSVLIEIPRINTTIKYKYFYLSSIIELFILVVNQR